MIVFMRMFWLFAMLTGFCSPVFADRVETEARIDAALAGADYRLAISIADVYLAGNPHDSAIRFRRAQTLRRLGTNDEALLDYERLVTDHPGNVDYAFGHAQVLSYVGRDRDALVELRRATRLSPNYEDVWRFRYQLLVRQHDDVATEEVADLRRQAEARFPNADWWRISPPSRPGEWTIKGGGGIEQLSDGLPGWKSQFAEINHMTAADTHYSFRVSRDERFDRSDKQISLGAGWLVAGEWNAGLDFMSAPDADFLPETQYVAHVGRQFAEGWNADLQLRRRNYDTAIVDSYTGLLEYYFGDFRAAWSMSLSHLHGASNSIGHTVYLNWYRTERTSFGVSITRGDEAEAIGAGQVLETTVQGITLTGRHKLNSRVSLDWWLGTHEQGDFYRRHYAGMAVSVGI